MYTDIEMNSYRDIVKYLKEEFNFDSNQDKFILDSGDNSVIAIGRYAGYSLYSLKKFVAKVQGISIEIGKSYHYYPEDHK